MFLSAIDKQNYKKPENVFNKNIFLILLLSLTLTGCSSKNNKVTASSSPPPVLTVSTIIPIEKSVKQILDVTGALAAWDLLSVQPAANGLKVTDIYTDAGQTVKKGQTLVKLDDSILKAQMASAMASLANSQAQLSKARNPNRDEDLLRQEAALTQAKANLNNARDNSQRYEALYNQGAVSRLDFETRKTTFQTSQALYDQEVQRLNLLKAGSRSEDIQIAQASVSSVNAQIQQINVQLAQTIVKAPESGLVFERLVHMGDVSSSASKMFSIIRDNRFELQAKVPEIDLRFIHTGDSVSVTSDANPNLKTTGKVRQIGPGVDPASRQATVKIDVSYVSGMQTGQFVKGQIVIGSARRVMIPTRSIINSEGNSQVFRISDSIAKATPVITGITEGEMIEIKSGLTTKDEVINEGAGFIKDGDRVKVVHNDDKGRKLP